ncbi:unnamed protein product [Phytophthora lilii]|uniref:Unnamed protein product n=1 Tax=Phytophthora lilii TaxID=2077276 RepID=A0A9W6TN26_9STRA|nr:unnamed protein product [Phytophthora lilii]
MDFKWIGASVSFLARFFKWLFRRVVFIVLLSILFDVAVYQIKKLQQKLSQFFAQSEQTAKHCFSTCRICSRDSNSASVNTGKAHSPSSWRCRRNPISVSFGKLLLDIKAVHYATETLSEHILTQKAVNNTHVQLNINQLFDLQAAKDGVYPP